MIICDPEGEYYPLVHALGGQVIGHFVFCIRIQCLALPIHGWVAIVNMLCAGLGDAKGALLLSTARQGSCFIPLVPVLAALFGAYGVASVQGAADVLTLALAIPVYRRMRRKISEAERAAKLG